MHGSQKSQKIKILNYNIYVTKLMKLNFEMHKQTELIFSINRNDIIKKNHYLNFIIDCKRKVLLIYKE